MCVSFHFVFHFSVLSLFSTYRNREFPANLNPSAQDLSVSISSSQYIHFLSGFRSARFYAIFSAAKVSICLRFQEIFRNKLHRVTLCFLIPVFIQTWGRNCYWHGLLSLVYSTVWKPHRFWWLPVNKYCQAVGSNKYPTYMSSAYFPTSLIPPLTISFS